jgi:hypothetical protein
MMQFFDKKELDAELKMKLRKFVFDVVGCK